MRDVTPASKTNLSAQDFLKSLRETGVVPVLTLEDVDKSVKLAKALVAGGLKILEITLRTKVALEAIAAIRDAVPEAIIGAGTIITPHQFDAALKLGCRFLISPGVTPALLNHAKSALKGESALYMPAASSLSEMMALQEAGITVQKLFPAEVIGGVSLLKSVAPVLPDILFNPTGGISLEKAPLYLSQPNVIAVGGSWIVPKDALEAGDFARITELAREARALRG